MARAARKENSMRIAVSTEDGVSICGHLGKCRSFIVYDTQNGAVSAKKLINIGGVCPGHGHDAHEAGHSHNVSPFEGCHAVITQGMGQGMLNALAGSGIRPVITRLNDPDEAVRLYLDGGLQESATSSCGCGKH
jgi:predicted Fe-Mo cluster-binding NifX family protein